jgi:hypothetical protein
MLQLQYPCASPYKEISVPRTITIAVDLPASPALPCRMYPKPRLHAACTGAPVTP